MISLKDFFETTEYKITDGDKYQWDCFGSNARVIDCADKSGWTDDWSASVVFDTEKQEVYEVSVYDYKNKRAYRLIHPDYVKAYEEEAKSRGVNGEQAWDDIEYTNLEVDEDFLEKATAIVNGEEYSTDVSVPLDIDRDTLYVLMLQAHKEDLTLNQYFNKVCKEYVEFL